MTQIPALNGIYTDGSADFRTAYPRNLIPVPKQQGISNGYLRPADGIEQVATGPGADRGGINWNGTQYRVMGTKLVSVSRSGDVTVLGDVGGAGPVTMDYSFDVLGIVSGGVLWYWDGMALTSLTDPDAGTVLDALWIAGYWMITDGTTIAVTELTDRYSVNPLKYGSAEVDPDPIVAVDELRNEAYALGRYTIEVFQNVGGNGFPYRRVDGAHVGVGVIGTHAYCEAGETFMFVGSSKNEAPGVFVMAPGNAQRLSTREIDQTLAGYSEEQLSSIVMERRFDKGHQHVLIHLPDQCLVYDIAATKAMGEHVWFTLTSSVQGLGQYRARNHVWCYDQWNVGDPVDGLIGKLVSSVSSHYGQINGWEFGTIAIYNESAQAIIHEIELVCLTGRIALGADPVIWTSYSTDGETWSMERPTKAGKQGERNKRIAWRTQGRIGAWRIQRFRGTSDAHVSIARLEVKIEPLFTKA